MVVFGRGKKETHPNGVNKKTRHVSVKLYIVQFQFPLLFSCGLEFYFCVCVYCLVDFRRIFHGHQSHVLFLYKIILCMDWKLYHHILLTHFNFNLHLYLQHLNLFYLSSRNWNCSTYSLAMPLARNTWALSKGHVQNMPNNTEDFTQLIHWILSLKQICFMYGT